MTHPLWNALLRAMVGDDGTERHGTVSGLLDMAFAACVFFGLCGVAACLFSALRYL